VFLSRSPSYCLVPRLTKSGIEIVSHYPDLIISGHDIGTRGNEIVNSFPLHLTISGDDIIKSGERLTILSPDLLSRGNEIVIRGNQIKKIPCHFAGSVLYSTFHVKNENI